MLYQQHKAAVLSAIAQDPGCAHRILRTLRAKFAVDKDVVLAAVQADGDALRWADVQLRIRKDITLAAVKQDGLSLRWAPPFFRCDREIVHAAVSKNGRALKYAGNEEKRSKEIVHVAVRSDGRAFLYADPRVQEDEQIAIDALQSEHMRISRLRPESRDCIAAFQVILNNQNPLLRKWHVRLLSSHPKNARRVMDAFVAVLKRDNAREQQQKAREVTVEEIDAFVDALVFLSSVWKDVFDMHASVENAMCVIASPSGLLGKRDRAAFEAEGICA